MINEVKELKEVFEVGKKYSICFGKEGFGQMYSEERFSRIGNEGDKKHEFLKFEKVSVETTGIKSFYVIDEPSNRSMAKYINITCKNGFYWVICELREAK